MGYWEERQAKAQQKLTDKGIREIEKQLKKYYTNSTLKIIGQFEETYLKLLTSIAEGREPTPADLYNLNKYWELQGQLKAELQKLGDKQIEFFTERFVNEYSQVYESTALKGDLSFSKASLETANQMINQIWCADGKSWSKRVWDNTDKLQQALNDNLIDCVVTGRKSSELKKMLMQQFDVSFNRADSVVRTEMAHIQTTAARQRYLDSGIKEVEVLVSPDERTCPICGKLDGKRFPIGGRMPVPAHPRCRCCIIPVVETEVYSEKTIDEKASQMQTENILTNSETKDTITVEEWTNGQFRDKKSEQRHHKHLEEYGDISFKEYVQGARELLSMPASKTIKKFVNNSGATYKYNTETNDFVIGKNGVIITRFKPKDGIKYWKDGVNGKFN